ncbi:MAG: sigma-70 family RNA polymerase sigma factor [Patescibacteria group bacterium]
MNDSNNDARSDEEILLLSVGDPNLFRLIVSRYEEAFLRKAKSILRDDEKALDCVQDTFTKIYFNASRFKRVEGASFKSWGYKILVNTSYTYYVKSKRDSDFTAHLDDELLAILPDVSSGNFAEEHKMRDYVISVFSRMPRELSRVLERHFLDWMAHKEIEEEEGISVAAVKTRVFRAKQLFKKVTGAMDAGRPKNNN